MVANKKYDFPYVDMYYDAKSKEWVEKKMKEQKEVGMQVGGGKYVGNYQVQSLKASLHNYYYNNVTDSYMLPEHQFTKYVVSFKSLGDSTWTMTAPSPRKKKNIKEFF